jgi:hypothetical protein
MPARAHLPLMLVIATVALAAALAAPGAFAASAAGGSQDAAAAKAKPRRLGGRVHRAWPAPGTRRPKTALTRWLARQVGPRKPLRCSERPARARVRCEARKRRGNGKGLRASAAGSGLHSTAATAATARGASVEAVRIGDGHAPGPLQLIRSFAIPADDPSYDRLLNWSWTYDSAVAATAFSAVGQRAQATRLLDQLAALQRRDGAIEFAFDVRTGESSRLIRSGSVAFAGIAFVDSGQGSGDKTYLDNARLAADYLLSLRSDDGLVRGGPDVKWASTQHNLLTFIFLANLSQRLEDLGDGDAAGRYREAAEGIAKGIDSELVVRDKGLLHFRQGRNDDIIPLDTQAIGTIYAFFRGDFDLAKQTYAFAQENFQVDGRSIERSRRPATYNMTYEAKGPFTGYRPYLGAEAPDVLWFEGTAQMRFISSSLGEPTDRLDESMKEWWSITRPDGLAPLGADRTVTKNSYNEYHVWPTAAAGAWTVLSGASQDTGWADRPEE